MLDVVNVTEYLHVIHFKFGIIGEFTLSTISIPSSTPCYSVDIFDDKF